MWLVILSAHLSSGWWLFWSLTPLLCSAVISVFICWIKALSWPVIVCCFRINRSTLSFFWMSQTWSFFSCESVICFVTCTLPVLNSAVLPVIIIVIYFLVSTVPVIMIGGPVISAAIEWSGFWWRVRVLALVVSGFLCATLNYAINYDVRKIIQLH